MHPWTTLVLGLLVGWLVEWVIDWSYWRRKHEKLFLEIGRLKRRLQVSEIERNDLQQEINALSIENQAFRDRCTSLEVDLSGLRSRLVRLDITDISEEHIIFEDTSVLAVDKKNGG